MSCQPLVEYITKLAKGYESQRDALGFTARWDAIHAAMRRSDEYHRRLKSGEAHPSKDGTTRGRVDNRVDLVRQKVLAAHSITSDALLAGGRLAFMLVDDSLPQEVAALRRTRPDLDDAITNRLDAIDDNQRYIIRQLEDGDAMSVVDVALKASAKYSVSYLKFITRPSSESEHDTGADGLLYFNPSARTIPGVSYVSPYHMLYDLSVGFDDSPMHIEQGRAFRHELAEMDDIPGVFLNTLREVVNGTDDTTSKASDTPATREIGVVTQPIRIFEAWGLAPLKHVIAALQERQKSSDGDSCSYCGPAMDDLQSEYERDDAQLIEVYALLAQGDKLLRLEVIRREDRPYFELPWEQIPDDSGFAGVGDAALQWDELTSSILRAAVDNITRTANLIIAVNRKLIDGQLRKTDIGTVLEMTDQEDINKAIQQLKLTDVSGPLRELIGELLAQCDLSTMIPRIEQGQQVSEPQTLGELRERVERAGKYLGSVIRLADKAIKGLVSRMYRHNMADPACPCPRIPLRVQALGFTSFENKHVRATRILSMFAMLKDDPDLRRRLNLAWWLEEMVKSADINPDQALLSPQQMLEQADQEIAMLQRQQAAASSQGQTDLALELADREARAMKMRADAERSLATAEKLRSDKTIAEARAVTELRAAAVSQPAPAPAPVPISPAVT